MTRRADIPFAQDSSRFFLPWVSMLMVFLAVLTLAGGMSAYSFLTEWNRGVSGSLTVQIPTVDEKGNSRAKQLNDEIETTLTLLRSSPGILGATVLSDEQMSGLMEPWMGDDADLTALPLPKLIDVAIDTQNPPQLEPIIAELADQVPSAVLDSHRIWLANLIKMANGMIKLTGFILLLLIFTTAFTVIYSTRTSLAVHRPVINLVHMMGSNDFYIAIQYAIRSFKLTGMGGIFGLLVALPVILGISYFFGSIAADYSIPFTRIQWIILYLTPVFFSYLSFLTTLQTVLSTLKRVL